MKQVIVEFTPTQNNKIYREYGLQVSANIVAIYIVSANETPLSKHPIMSWSREPDEFAVCGREIYLRLPNGVARTKLTNAYFDSRLATTSTVRNWRTTLKLLALAVG